MIMSFSGGAIDGESGGDDPLSDDERAELEAQDVAGASRRARIVLAAAEGLENKEIAVRLRRARTPWASGVKGLDGLYDEPRPGAPRQIG